MRVAVYSTKAYDRRFLDATNRERAHDFLFLEPRLSSETAPLAAGCEAVCVFVNDVLDADVLERLAEEGVRLVVLRCAGFNNVDIETAARLGIAVGRVPAYSPASVAEHTLALVLTLNRKTHRAYNRVREGNFALDGLLGFDLSGKTVGIVGTGKIGAAVARIFAGFGCVLLGHDLEPDRGCEALGMRYVDWDEMCRESHVLTLHCPLTPKTHHLVDDAAIARMRPGVMLVNTSRGAVVDTRAVVAGLKSGAIGSLALDVYEEEADLFFEDLSDRFIDDDVFARLLTFPNVLITGHQAFFTEEALGAIAATTLANLDTFAARGAPAHPVSVR